MDNEWVKIQPQDFNAADELRHFESDQTGAVVSFIGKVRGGTITQMYLEHYPGMTETVLLELIHQAKTRWDIMECKIIHRVGTLFPQQQIVMVMVSSAHRKPAFAACEFLIDHLKTKAPFWKKEFTSNSEYWVTSKHSDELQSQKWED